MPVSLAFQRLEHGDPDFLATQGSIVRLSQKQNEGLAGEMALWLKKLAVQI